MIAQRIAQISMQNTRKINPKLRPKRLVKPEFRAYQCIIRLVTALSGKIVNRVAGRQMYQEKIDDNQQQYENNRLNKSPNEQPVKKTLGAIFHKLRSHDKKNSMCVRSKMLAFGV